MFFFLFVVFLCYNNRWTRSQCKVSLKKNANRRRLSLSLRSLTNQYIKQSVTHGESSKSVTWAFVFWRIDGEQGGKCGGVRGVYGVEKLTPLLSGPQFCFLSWSSRDEQRKGAKVKNKSFTTRGEGTWFLCAHRCSSSKYRMGISPFFFAFCFSLSRKIFKKVF